MQTTLRELKAAVKRADLQTVERLLEETQALVVDRSERWSPLQDAAFQGNAAMLRRMIELGSGITAGDVAHAMHHAVQLPHANREAVEALLSTGLLPEPFASIFRGEREAEATLRSEPGLVEARDAEGCTPLMRAAECGHARLIPLLLELGADVEARAPGGQSALGSCACNQIDVKKRSATLRALLAGGAQVDGRIYHGRTPLFSAATAGWHPEESVTLLLEHGADPNARDTDGRSVLEEVLRLPASARFRRVADLLRAAGGRTAGP